MTSGRIFQPDTDADQRVQACLSSAERRSFVVVAGAGSGKTTSLVKALATVVRQHGAVLRRRRQRVACVTYTEIAAREIWADVGGDPLVHVSTIHSYAWMLTRSFQGDIRIWVERRIHEKLVELRAAAAAFGPRVLERTREKNRRDIERYEREHERIGAVSHYIYSVGSNYAKGQLGHDDVIKIATEFISERPLFRTLLAQQFPFVLVDESQDTTDGIVQALKAVDEQMHGSFCLGFFGDPMQRIYATGIGDIVPNERWLTIAKPENFRCSTEVLNVANAIRRSGDDLVQTRGRMQQIDGVLQPVGGTARIFVLPTTHNRGEQIRQVREWVAAANSDTAWLQTDDNAVKVLVIVHRMAAIRLGFEQFYNALNDKAPNAFKNGFLDATAWPVRPLVQFALPLSDAIRNDREFEAMMLLRDQCEQLQKDYLNGRDVRVVLQNVREASHRLEVMMRPEEGRTIRDVLIFLRDSELLTLDQRLLAYLEQQLPPVEEDVEQDEGDAEKEANAMDRFLACPAAQLWGYQRYIRDESPFSTQQGIKGTEFERVLVVLDDEEGTHTQFSYDKYFGIKDLSDRDLKNIEEGMDSVVDRTRRLFYVCCTRSLRDLVVILFHKDPDLAEARVRSATIFSDNAILNRNSIM
ncbi:UvrD-helicase domain-containing protein [Methylobacterium bullatum]|uniref:ATP-dependent DNA helicase PcrA n=1 Tax=Methylobacterium bullatum TaxID=570505 RepID=A0A679JRU5_9HYPH|nr:ATP-dependent DNA helicase PcrA [Methylobacterium bullatum]